MSDFEPNAALYEKGIAFGASDVRTDTLTFRFRDEQFTFPTSKVLPGIALWNGYFYEAHIDDLRKLEAEAVSP